MLSQREALIAGIRAAPHDDGPRLVCSDWFEEQGGEANIARAEFIRIQIQRARLPVTDIRHSELQARELRLLKRYAPIWCGSHFVFRKSRFRRGFIEAVHLHLQHFLHHRRQMLALEPVRDISLTGWHRAPAELVRRVAACEEWQGIETLRIHHQGPHNDVPILLESPHLLGLRALSCPAVQFNADTRRRFERLPVLRQIEDLNLQVLHTRPEIVGEWLSDGGLGFAAQWDKLKSFTFPRHDRLDLLHRIASLPWWNRLTKIALLVDGGETLAFLGNHLPEGLQDLHLGAGSFHADLSGLELLLEQLSSVPLRSLNLQHIKPLPPASLSRLLDGTNRWELQELHLYECDINEAHTRVLAEAPGVQNLYSLELSGTRSFGAAAARSLFASQMLKSLIHLNLCAVDLGSEGAFALAKANGWDRLRSLDLSWTQLKLHEVRELLTSPNLRHLTWLKVSVYEDALLLQCSGELIHAITKLPHLAYLQLEAHLDVQSRQLLSESDSVAWQFDFCDYDGMLRCPTECMPPLEGALESIFRGRLQK